MPNAPDPLEVLAARVVDFAFPADGLAELEPVHFTTDGYEHLVAAAAAARRSATR